MSERQVQFSWGSIQDGVAEWPRCAQVVKFISAEHSYLFHEPDLLVMVPEKPDIKPPNENPRSREYIQWQKRTETYEAYYRKVSLGALTATASFRALFPYGTQGYNEFEILEQEHLGLDPVARFKAIFAGMATLYRADNPADINQYRLDLQSINDRNGFDPYFTGFTNGMALLQKANALPSRAESNLWVRNGLQNMELYGVSFEHTQRNPNWTWKTFLEAVRSSIADRITLGFDPYRTVRTTNKPVNGAIVTANFATAQRPQQRNPVIHFAPANRDPKLPFIAPPLRQRDR